MLRASFDARPVRASHPKEHALATPNYGYEKRQRELAKKRKSEEKKQKKQVREPGDNSPDDQAPNDAGPDVAPVPPAAG